MRLHIKDRLDYFIDDVKNFWEYRSMKKKANRDQYNDMNKLSGNEKTEFVISDDGMRNELIIDGKVVLNMTFAETAMFYRFMRKCIYR